MKKAKNLEEKKVALTGFEPGPPDPKSTIYTPIPTSSNRILKKFLELIQKVFLKI